MISKDSIEEHVEKHKGLVIKIANYMLHRYNQRTPPELKRHIDLDDLTQAGFIALIKSRDEYREDHESGCQFETFAFHKIKGAIKSHLYTHISPIHSRYYSRFGKDDLSEENAMKARASSRCKFFSELSGHSEGMDITEDIEDYHENFASIVDSQDTIDFILRKIDSMSKDESLVCKMRLIDHKTFSDIGLELGISGEGARLKYAAAVKKLKCMLGSLNDV